jgi:hypothetical protein
MKNQDFVDKTKFFIWHPTFKPLGNFSHMMHIGAPQEIQEK